MLAHEAAPTSPPEAALPPVEVESAAESAIAATVELAIEPFRVPEGPTPQLAAPERPPLAEWADFGHTRLTRKPPAATPASFRSPRQTEAVDAAAAVDTARPDVPTAIPGENPAPEYPAFARRRGIEGTVVVGIEVDANGAAAACRIVTSSGSTSLDHAALAAARRWRFTRGPGQVEVPFVFQIRS